MTDVLASTVARALRDAVAGRVTGPGDAGWDAVRRPWNLHVDQQPAAVVEPLNAADIAAAIRVARREGVPVTAQPRGHGATAALDGASCTSTWPGGWPALARVCAGSGSTPR
jgi:hypothetical protein